MTDAGSWRVRLTDATFGDASQSLLGGRLGVEELLPVARRLDGVGLAALEVFGGGAFGTCLESGEDPWARLRRLREAMPNTPLQAVVRGQYLVGSRTNADDVVELFVTAAADAGVDVFRISDPLNDVRNMEVAVRAARRANRRVQGSLSYAVDPAHDLSSWCSLARRLAALDVDELVVDDTCGLLTPRAARALVAVLRDQVGQPVLVHSRCASGLAPMTYVAAVEAGAAGLDTALSPLAGGASLPATESLAAALAGGEHDTGLDLAALVEIGRDLQALLDGHADRRPPEPGRIHPEILRYGMPVSMLEDVSRQLDRHNAAERLAAVLAEVPRVREELGFPPLVTPIRQLIASQAVFNVLGGDRYATVTQELKEYLQGLYGESPQPADPEIRRLVLGQDAPITIRPADLLDGQVDAARSQLTGLGLAASADQIVTYVMFPDLALDLYRSAGPPGEEPSEDGEDATPVETEAAVEPNGAAAADTPAEAGAEEPVPQLVTSEFEVEVEGEVFRVRVSGAGMTVAPAASSGAPSGGGVSQAAPPRPRDGAITAPMQGLIVKVPVAPGDQVSLGDVVAVLEAMKMQNDIVATRPGKVLEVYVKEGEVVSPNQPLVAIG